MPTISGDFVGMLGLKYMWVDESEMKNDQFKAKIKAIVFLFLSINLFISIVLTIRTPPGSIPDGDDWRIPDSDSEEEYD